MKIYNKLVRDLIPQIIKNDGKKADIHTASNKEYSVLLEAKLKEEVEEYLEAKNLEELADVMEVLVGLANNLGFTEEELFNKRLIKREKRGGFEKKIVLEKIYD